MNALTLRYVLIFTSTSPSFYLEFVGTVGVHDKCGTISSTVNNPFVAVPVGGLTTYEEANTVVGDEINPPLIENGTLLAGGTFKPLKLVDVECPTWGVGTLLSIFGGSVRTATTIGPPWLPIIIPPLNAMTLNPLWETLCTSVSSNYNDHFFDPPRSLTPAQLMVPTLAPSPVDPPRADPGTNLPARPGKTPIADQPLQTGVPGGPLGGDPPGTAADSDTPADPNHQSQDEYSGRSSSAEGSSEAKIQDSHFESSNQPDNPANHLEPTDGASNDDHTDLGGKVDPGDAIQSNIGEAIMQALNTNTPPNLDPSAANDGAQENPNAAQSSNEAITPPALKIGGQPFTPSPTGFEIGGTPISPNGPAATITGTKISLAPSGTLHIGDQTFNISPNPIATPSPLTIGRLTLTANPTGFQYASSSVVPNGPPITNSGTAISLANSNILFINNKPTTLPPSSKTAPLLLQAGSQFFNPNPHGFTIAGTSIAPGGPAAVVSGTKVSLNPSGTLALGYLTLNPNDVVATAAVTAAANSALSIGTHPFMHKPTGFVVDKQTIEPGGTGVVVYGTSVSLGIGGVLHVGGEVVTLTTVEGAGISSAATTSTGVETSGTSVRGGNGTGLGNVQASEGASAAGCVYYTQRVLWSLAVTMVVQFLVY